MFKKFDATAAYRECWLLWKWIRIKFEEGSKFNDLTIDDIKDLWPGLIRIKKQYGIGNLKHVCPCCHFRFPCNDCLPIWPNGCVTTINSPYKKLAYFDLTIETKITCAREIEDSAYKMYRLSKKRNS